MQTNYSDQKCYRNENTLVEIKITGMIVIPRETCIILMFAYKNVLEYYITFATLLS